VEGFVFDLATGDFDGDGHDEIAAACADGLVRTFSSEGKSLWTYNLLAPVYQAAFARIDGRTPVVLAGGISRELTVLSTTGTKVFAKKFEGALRVVRAVSAGGGTEDAVMVFTVSHRRPGPIEMFQGPNLSPVPRAAGETIKAAPQSTNRTMDGVGADLDGDGREEWISGEGVYSVAGGLRRRFDLKEAPAANYDYRYRMRQIVAGNLTDAAGLEIVTLDGPDLMLHDARGKLLGRAHAPFGFTALAYLPGKPFGSIVLGSSPNGDDNLYRVAFTPGWEKEMESLPRRGHMAKIGASLAELSANIRHWKGEPAAGQPGPYLVSISGGWMDTPAKLDRIDRQFEIARFYEKRFPYPNLVFVLDFWFTEAGPMLRPDGKPWERDHRLKYEATAAQIVEAARKLERAKIRFFATSGHGNAPYLSPETAAAILQAAPTMCQGFVEAETEPTKGMEALCYYLQHHVVPIMEVCRRLGRGIMILREKDAWWAAQAATPELRRILFNGAYRQVIVPSVEDSNSRSHDLNLAARVGLWLDGQVDRWACRICADNFSFNRAWEWEYPMTGHPHLRNYTAHLSLGASVFMLQSGEREPGSGEFTRVGLEGAEPFLHMLGKGIFAPPTREQMKSISPVLLNVLQPTERFLATVANGHHLQRFTPADLEPFAFSRLDVYWGLAPTPATDVGAFVYGRTRQFDNTIPRTPAGFVALLAGSAPTASHVPWTIPWTSNGDRLANLQGPASLDAARSAIHADLQAGVRKFPFSVEGEIFWQLVSQGDGQFLLYLIDPGYVDPAERTVAVHLQTSGDWLATDRLTGAQLGDLRHPLEVRVPAGALRLIQLFRASEGVRAQPQRKSSTPSPAAESR
jgi:hypothetical protein